MHVDKPQGGLYHGTNRFVRACPEGGFD